MEVLLLADPHLSEYPDNSKGRMFAHSRRLVREAIDTANARRPDLVFWLGDLTHEGTPAVRNAFAEELARLTVPSLQITGNHDVETISAEAFAKQIPVMGQGLLHWDGWTVAVLDTVKQRSPDDPDGFFAPPTLALLRDAIRTADGGPLLTLHHHPPRDRFTNHPDYFTVMAQHPGPAVSIAGHTHMNRYEVVQSCHCLERSAMIVSPIQIHRLSLSPQHLAIEPIDLGDPAWRDTSDHLLATEKSPDAPTINRGPPTAQRVRIDLRPQKGVGSL